MRRLTGLVFVLIFGGLLGGCAGMVQSKVSVFHEIEPSKPLAFAMIPYKHQESSLEYKSYAERIRQALKKVGYTETAPVDSDVVVFFDYGIDNGHEVAESYPIWGQTGGGSTSYSGNVYGNGGSASYSGTATRRATYGVVGSGTSSSTEYKRTLHLEFVDNKYFLATKKYKRVYEANVVSVGHSETLAPVMPAMIKAIFENFPGKSGDTRTTAGPLGAD